MDEQKMLTTEERLENIEADIRRGKLKRSDINWMITRMHQLVEENKEWEKGAHSQVSRMLELDAQVYQANKRLESKESFFREILATLENRLAHYRSSY